MPDAITVRVKDWGTKDVDVVPVGLYGTWAAFVIPYEHRGFSVAHVPTGLRLKTGLSEREAKALAKLLNTRVPNAFPNATYGAVGAYPDADIRRIQDVLESFSSRKRAK